MTAPEDDDRYADEAKVDPDEFDVEEPDDEQLPDDAGEPGEDEGIDGGIPHIDTGGTAGDEPGQVSEDEVANQPNSENDSED